MRLKETNDNHTIEGLTFDTLKKLPRTDQRLKGFGLKTGRKEGSFFFNVDRHYKDAFIERVILAEGNGVLVE